MDGTCVVLINDNRLCDLWKIAGLKQAGLCFCLPSDVVYCPTCGHGLIFENRGGAETTAGQVHLPLLPGRGLYFNIMGLPGLDSMIPLPVVEAGFFCVLDLAAEGDLVQVQHQPRSLIRRSIMCLLHAISSISPIKKFVYLVLIFYFSVFLPFNLVDESLTLLLSTFDIDLAELCQIVIRRPGWVTRTLNARLPDLANIDDTIMGLFDWCRQHEETGHTILLVMTLVMTMALFIALCTP